MGILANITKTIARGASNTFRYPVFSNRGGAYSSGYGYWNDWLVANLLPGSDYDYIAEAGDLWKCAVVAACLNFLMRTFPQPRLVLMQSTQSADGLKEEASLEHALLELLNDPNEDDDDLTYLLQTWVMDWNLYGNVYWLLIRNFAGRGPVKQIQYIPRQLMKPIPDMTGRKRVAGYSYYVDGQYVVYAPEDILHFRFSSDPQNPREGLSPLMAACRDIVTENELSTLAGAVARNMGIAPWIVGPGSTDSNAIIESDTMDLLEQKWDNRQRDNRGKPIFFRQNFKVEKIGMSPQELMADEARAVAVSRICASFNIDPMVIGLPSSSKTFSNYTEANKAVYDQNIIPSGDAFCTRINRKFRDEPGYEMQAKERLAFDYSLVPAMQEDQDKVHERAQGDFKAGFVTVNDARTAAGYAAEKDAEKGEKYLWEVKQAGQQQNPDEEDFQGNGQTSRQQIPDKRQKSIGQYKYGSTQINLPQDFADRLQSWSEKFIPDSILAADGRESDSHITVKYGLKSPSVEEVAKALAGMAVIYAEVGTVQRFTTNADFDVLYLSVKSDDLQRANKLIAAWCDCVETHPEYTPHITIAYVQKGKGKNLLGSEAFLGEGISFDTIYVSNQDGIVLPVALAGMSED